jgi:hypothetical protein
MRTPRVPITEPDPEEISMTERAEQLRATADGQIGDLIALISTLDEAALRLPCPARETLGDGTIAASVRHTAVNYERIAAFVQGSDRMSSAHGPAPQGAPRIPRFVRAFGHGPADHARRGPGVGEDQHQYTAENIDLRAVVNQLSASRNAWAESPS